jgi:hypothetical protein
VILVVLDPDDSTELAAGYLAQDLAANCAWNPGKQGDFVGPGVLGNSCVRHTVMPIAYVSSTAERFRM